MTRPPDGGGPPTADRPVPIRPLARGLLTAGAASGPVFVVGSGLGVALRDGFDLTRLPVSALSLGPEGWTQTAVFLLSGGLALALAAGLREALAAGPGRRMIPVLVGLHGAGLVGAGLFVTDPGGGFPAGAPADFPTRLSWHAVAHSIAAMTAMTAATVGLAGTGRRMLAARRIRVGVVHALGALGVVVLLAWPDGGSFGLRLALASVLTCAWTTGLAVDGLRRPVAPGVRLGDRAGSR